MRDGRGFPGKKARRWAGVMLVAVACMSGCRMGEPERGFEPLFDGAALQAWGCGPGGEGAFEVQEEILASRPGRSGRLFTERQYADFVLRFEFQTEARATCGLALRAVADDDPAVMGIEMQVGAGTEAGTGPGGLGGHGSIPGVVETSGGYLRGAEAWNQQEIICQGRRIRSMVNGRVVLDVNFNQFARPEIFLRRPGLLQEKGRIGLIAKGGRIILRGLEIRELPRPYLLNMSPEGFTELFDGQTLKNWEGWVADPPTRAKMSEGDYKVERIRADYLMTQNWTVRDGALVYRGSGFDNLCSVRDYGNFELMVDWQIQEGADSGIYLRGCPQIQIWDRPVGSGGLYNNQVQPSQPLKRADRYYGSWNRFRIVMVGERVTVVLNDTVVVHDAVMENYWERDKPVYTRGPIELQAHETPIAFRNVYIRELP